MPEYLLYDRDKAAFINRVNKLLKQLPTPGQLDNSDFIDIPGSGSEDKCIFATSVSAEISLLDLLIRKGVFNYKVKKIDLKNMVNEIVTSLPIKKRSKI